MTNPGFDGTKTRTSQVFITDYINAEAVSAPAASGTGEGRLYFDSGANAFRFSENGGAYKGFAALESDGKFIVPSTAYSTDGTLSGMALNVGGGIGATGQVRLVKSDNTNFDIADTVADLLVLESASSTGITIAAPTGTLSFGNASSSGANKRHGAIDYTVGTSTMILRAGFGSKAMTLTSTGHTCHRQMDFASYIDQTGIAAPAVSSAGKGRIYFDSTSNTFKVSENGGAYEDLVGGGGGGVTFPLLAPTSGAVPYSFTGNTGTGMALTGTFLGMYQSSGLKMQFAPGAATMYTPLYAVAGTNVAPGFAFTGDGNTGLYLPSADTIGITTDGTKRVEISASGLNVDGQGGAAQHTISGGSGTLDFNGNNSNVQRINATGNVTLTTSNLVDGYTYTLIFSQDGTGTRTLTFPGSFEWEGGTAPTITTTGNTITVVTWIHSGSEDLASLVTDIS